MRIFLKITDNFINIPWLILLGGILLVAAVSDIKTKRIPNAVTFPTILLGAFAMALSPAATIREIAFRVLVFLAVFLFGAANLLGLGDIKLLMGVSLFVSPYAFACLVVFSMALLVLKHFIQNARLSAIRLMTFSIRYGIDKKNGEPYAPYLFLIYLIYLVLVIICRG